MRYESPSNCNERSSPFPQRVHLRQRACIKIDRWKAIDGVLARSVHRPFLFPQSRGPCRGRVSRIRTMHRFHPCSRNEVCAECYWPGHLIVLRNVFTRKRSAANVARIAFYEQCRGADFSLRLRRERRLSVLSGIIPR